MIVTNRCIDLRRAETPVAGIQPLSCMDMRQAGNQSVVINLRAEVLDPRVTYAGPVHIYWSEENRLDMSPENLWPLEYRDGVAVGRHEPEPAATNFQGASLLATVDGADYVGTVGMIVGDMSGPTGFPIVTFNNNWDKAAIYSNAEASWLVPEYPEASESTFIRRLIPFVSRADSQLRTYIARLNAGNYCYALSQPVPAGSGVASFFNCRDTDQRIGVSLIQVESGVLATSPIITGTGVSENRAAASVSIDTSGGFSALRVHFSAGEAEQHAVTGNSFLLPVASRHWGERYITQLELVR